MSDAELRRLRDIEWAAREFVECQTALLHDIPIREYGVLKVALGVK